MCENEYQVVLNYATLHSTNSTSLSIESTTNHSHPGAVTAVGNDNCLRSTCIFLQTKSLWSKNV